MSRVDYITLEVSSLTEGCILSLGSIRAQEQRGPVADALVSLACGGCDLHVRRGEILGVLGHDGSGKSALVRDAASTFLADDRRITLSATNRVSGRILRSNIGAPIATVPLVTSVLSVTLVTRVHLTVGCVPGRIPTADSLVSITGDHRRVTSCVDPARGVVTVSSVCRSFATRPVRRTTCPNGNRTHVVIVFFQREIAQVSTGLGVECTDRYDRPSGIVQVTDPYLTLVLRRPVENPRARRRGREDATARPSPGLLPWRQPFDPHTAFTRPRQMPRRNTQGQPVRPARRTSSRRVGWPVTSIAVRVRRTTPGNLSRRPLHGLRIGDVDICFTVGRGRCGAWLIGVRLHYYGARTREEA